MSQKKLFEMDEEMSTKNSAWEIIFKEKNFFDHDFSDKPAFISAKEIKKITKSLDKNSHKEPRILCKQDTRESRPSVFQERNLFLLPIKNGHYAIIQGEGYADISEITESETVYQSKLDFSLDTSQAGDSEMQHLDFAYASSIIRTFLNDDSLVLTIRGRKFTKEFSFKVGKQIINVKSVQTEVDGGYEGRNQVVLIEAKNTKQKNIIIRQLFFPLKQWSLHTNKKIKTIFFSKQKDTYLLWEFEFEDLNDYNSIKLGRSKKYKIVKDT